MMRVLKADWILPVIVLAPVVVLGGLMALSSWQWYRNSTTQHDLVADLISHEPTLESIASDERFQEIRHVHEIMVASSHLTDWKEASRDPEQRNDIDWSLVGLSSDPANVRLARLVGKFSALGERAAKLIESPGFSIEHAFPSVYGYASLGHGSIESMPVWLLEQSPYLQFKHAVGDGDSARVFASSQRLLQLLLPADGEPMSWDVMVYLTQVLSDVRAVAAHGLLNDQQLAEMDQVLRVSVDWEGSWAIQRSRQAWVVDKLLKAPDVIHRSHFLVGYHNQARLSELEDVNNSFAPSEVLAIACNSLPPHDLADAMPFVPVYRRDQSKVHFQGIDQWIKPWRMSSPVLATTHQNHALSFSNAIQKTQVSLLFTRASLAMARLLNDTNGDPVAFDTFARLGWTRSDIVTAKEELELVGSNHRVGIRSRSAEWIKDGDGKVLDGGYSKEVWFD